MCVREYILMHYGTLKRKRSKRAQINVSYV